MAIYTLTGTFTAAGPNRLIVQYARFKVTQAGTVTIDAANLGRGTNGSDSNGTDAEMYLFTADGRKLAFDQDSGDGFNGFNARITIDLPVGEYFVAVGEYGNLSQSDGFGGNSTSFTEAEALRGTDFIFETPPFDFEISLTEGTAVTTGLVGAANESLFDTSGADKIFGLQGDDTITSRNGTDTVNGGTGNDTLVLDWSASNGSASNAGNAVPTVNVIVGGFDGGFYRTDLGEMFFSSIENFRISTGGGSDNIITASGNDVVNTGAGDDFVNVGTGTDQADGGAGDDGITADLSESTTAIVWNLGTNSFSGGPDSFANFEYFGTVTTGSGDDVITTTVASRNETINTGAGNDTITSFNGTDRVNGGTGSDTLILDWSGSNGSASNAGNAAPTVNGTEGEFNGGFYRSDLGEMFFTSIGRLVITTGGGADDIKGIGNDDVITTGGGNDTVTSGPGAGRDRIDLGAGFDKVSADWSDLGAGQNVVLDLTGANGGSVTLGSGETERYIRGAEQLVEFRTGGGDDVITTRRENETDVVFTGAGNDTIMSFNGTDRVNGGTGNDTLILDWSGSNGSASNAGDAPPTMNSAEGEFNGGFYRTDLGEMFFTSIGRFVVSTGGGGDSIITATGNDVVSTGGGNDVVDVGSGLDQADGGDGEDGLSADLRAAGTTAVRLNLQTNQYSGPASTSFTNFEYFGTLTTGGGDDVIVTTALARNEVINSGAGDDRVTIVRGVDRVNGGTGTDTLVVDYSAATDVVEMDFNRAPSANTTEGGFDGGFYRRDTGNQSFFTSIERIEITTGSGDDNLILTSGNDIIRTRSGMDTIDAGAGDDFIDGGTGQDTMRGGAGDDIYVVNQSDDRVIENGNEGEDEVQTDIASYTLGSNVENLTGTGAVDQSLTGNDQDNVIDGGAGADAMAGGRGSDVYVVDFTRDTVTEQAGQGIDQVNTALPSYTLSANVENLVGLSSSQALSGNGLNNGIIGTTGNDTLSGLSGSDVLIGLTGADTLDGGTGRDILIGGVVLRDNLVVNGSFETQDGTNDSRQYVLNGPGGVEAGDYGGVRYRTAGTLAGWERSGSRGFELNTYGDNGYGDPAFDRGDGDTVLDLEAGFGENTTISQVIPDLPAGQSLLLSFTAAKGTGSAAGSTAVLEVIWNGAVVATITSNSTAATQHAFIVTASGTGADRLSFREIGEGTDARGTSLDAVALNAIVPGQDQQGDSFAGGAGNDTLIGDAGADTLDGGTGSDVMAGGAGNDTYIVDEGASDRGQFGDIIVEDANGGRDTVRTSAAVIFLADNVEVLRGTGAPGGQVLIGNALDNEIFAHDSGENYLDGGEGADRLVGGTGADHFYVDNAGDTVVEAPGGGEDEIVTALASYSLADLPNVENLTANAEFDAAYKLTGNAGANRITGGDQGDTLDGGQGADTLIGRGGNDVYIVDNLDDVVVENAGEGDADEVRTSVVDYVLPANIEKLTYTGSEMGRLRGNASNNIIAGAAASDLFYLQDGGDDTASGGAGGDAFYYGAALTAGDRNDGGEGADIVALQGNYAGLTLGTESLVNVETLSFVAGSDTRFGDTGNNRYSYVVATVDANVAAGTRLTVNGAALLAGENLTFNGSAETDGTFFIYGGKGTDTLTGGKGADVFFFAEGRFNPGDRFDGGAGSDILTLRGDYSGANAIRFADDTMSGIETISLLSVSDTRFFGGGQFYSYDLTTSNGNVAAGEVLTVNGARLLAGETMRFDGSAESDGAFRIFGGAGDDRLIGGAGNDLFYAGAGRDEITGGAGADTFQYRATSESNAGAADRILLFQSGTDVIDLSRIDANTTNGDGNDAFSFIGSNAFDGTAGQLRVSSDGNGGYVIEGDTDGNGVADLVILLDTNGQGPPVAADFNF